MTKFTNKGQLSPKKKMAMATASSGKQTLKLPDTAKKSAVLMKKGGKVKKGSC